MRSITTLCAVLCLSGATGGIALAQARTVSVSDAWTRPTIAGAADAVGYLTVRNGSAQADRLLDGASPVAATIEIHRSTLAAGVMRMRDVTDGVAIPAHASVAFAPDGYHLMLVGPKRRFRPGDRIPAVLRFARAGAIAVTFAVRSAPATPPMKMR